jgi:hypothetical protein
MAEAGGSGWREGVAEAEAEAEALAEALADEALAEVGGTWCKVEGEALAACSSSWRHS